MSRYMQDPFRNTDLKRELSVLSLIPLTSVSQVGHMCFQEHPACLLSSSRFLGRAPLVPGPPLPRTRAKADWVPLRSPREPPVLKARMLCLRKRKRILLSKETWERADAPTASGVPWRTFKSPPCGRASVPLLRWFRALPLPLPGSFSQRRRKARGLRVQCGWWESLGGLRNPSSGIYQRRSFPLASVPAQQTCWKRVATERKWCWAAFSVPSLRETALE
ncbi:uncharacterized protein LOC105740228 [Nomascus leucogenys]|uniref:uncharacterized protein LOC105740228 n=1 Tax=Nomascus leucogenys TaxID=61853 RepID=UPI00020ABC25|nr:uncharacterized protein LOC105740228 [Nomascus leucogenys]